MNNETKNWELVNFCEYDKYATQAYCSIHDVDESLNLGDITKVDETKLSDFNMICGGSPCFVEGTLVLTESGYKPIEEIKIGDSVLTHNNKWQKVIHTMTNEINGLYRIKSMPSEDIHCTSNHPFYVRKKYRKWNDSLRRYERLFEKPEWITANKLSRECYVGTAINTKSKLPHWEGIIKSVNATDSTYIENTLSDKFNTKEFWYIIGRFIGDGWIRNDSGIIICANDSELYQIIPYLEKLNWNYCVSKERTVNKIHIAFKEIGEYCLRFGRSAANKHLTSDILNLPVDLLKSFIEGFVSSDGTQDSNGLYRITSVSREMIYELGQCVSKVYHRPFSIYFTQRTKTTVIEGRTVNQKDTYSIHYKLTTNTQDKAFYEDGYIWSPINDVLQEDYNGLVYNLEVEEDNSYVVQNIIVHNCQDFSVAGKQNGSIWRCNECENSDGTPTEWNPLTIHYTQRHKCPCCGSENIDKSRSSLLVEYLRVIRHNKPNFGIYENVKNIVGKKFKDTFKMFTDELEEYGYSVHWKVLNAKDYGVPQNRERVYLIFIKKELDNGKFKFPEPFDNGIRLKDVLESEVDEKYYISDEKVQRFLTKLNNTDALLYDACQVKREGKSRKYDEYSPTLTARDYKDPRLVNDNQVKQLGNIVNTGNWDNPQRGRIYSPEGCSPALNTCGGGGLEPKILQVGKLNSSQDGVMVSDVGIAPTHTAGHGNTPKIIQVGNVNPSGNGMNGNVFSDEGLAPTLTTNKGEGSKIFLEELIRIRKLIPLETFRLMGFSDEDFYKAMIGYSKVAKEFIDNHPYLIGKTIADEATTIQGISNNQLYKMSGNSIVVDVLYYIYVELYKAMPYLFDDLKLSSFFSGIGAFEVALDRLYDGINTGNFTRPQVE